MRIRLLKLKDIDEVVSVIITSSSKENKNKKWDEKFAYEYIKRIYKLNKEICFVATENGKIVGVALSRINPEFNKYVLISDMLLVHPKHRNKKIATKLLKKTCIKAQNKYHIEKIQISIDTLLDFPVIWYESIGLKKIKNLEVLNGSIDKIIRKL